MATILGYINYTTQAGDRWDGMAYKGYGDIQQMGLLIASNREVGIPPAFKAGVILRVPIIADNDLTSPDLLPPWKR